MFALSLPAFCADPSDWHVKVPDSKGRLVKAGFALDDMKKSVRIEPLKGSAFEIPYSQIDKFNYEYTKKHRVNDETIATAPLGIGAVAMLTKSRSHWLTIDYHEQNIPKEYVLRMEKRDYIHILDAIKAHTGMDAEVLGNADKRR
jgi:hypothetical protein